MKPHPDSALLIELFPAIRLFQELASKHGIHDVFQLLDLSRKTGILRVSSELRNNEGQVCFDGGAVVYAEIRSNPHRLGALLVHSGKIDEADLGRLGAASAKPRVGRCRCTPRSHRNEHCDRQP